MVDRDASQVRDSSQQSSDMVERVARVLRPVLFEGYGATVATLDPDRQRTLDKAWAALEACHHAALVEALREIQALVDGTARNGIPEDRAKEYGRALSDIWAKADVVLAKIGTQA